MTTRLRRSPRFLATAAAAILSAASAVGCKAGGAAVSPYPQAVNASHSRMLRPIAVDDSRPVREPPPDPSLSDYLAVAALENPGLKAAFHRWQADVERTHFAGRLPDPRFSYTYYMEEVETRVGPRRQSFALSQMLPWFGKLSLREKALMPRRRRTPGSRPRGWRFFAASRRPTGITGTLAARSSPCGWISNL